MQVFVTTKVNKHRGLIEQAGLHLIPIKISRGGLNPLSDILMLFSLIGIYQRIRPDIVHHVAMKPVLYGSLAAYISGIPHIVNALAGMGFIFSSNSRMAAWLRPFIRFAFRSLLGAKKTRLIMQNPDDRDFFVHQTGVPENHIVLIAGSGVDISHFCPCPFPEAPPVVVTLVARMLEDKGVHEFVDAVRMLKKEGCNLRAILVGEEDLENPAHIPHSMLLAWVEKGVVEWWGKRDDILEIWAQSHIAVLPSYREGLPKSLLEAAACARPIIASDVPGCREIVHHNKNGFLVQAKNASALAEAMKMLINDPELRTRMGARGRELVEHNFSNEIVVRNTLGLYKELLGNKWPKLKNPIR